MAIVFFPDSLHVDSKIGQEWVLAEELLQAIPYGIGLAVPVGSLFYRYLAPVFAVIHHNVCKGITALADTDAILHIAFGAFGKVVKSIVLLVMYADERYTVLIPQDAVGHMLLARDASFAEDGQFVSSRANHLAQVMVGIFVYGFVCFLVPVEIKLAIDVEEDIMNNVFAHSFSLY